MDGSLNDFIIETVLPAAQSIPAKRLALLHSIAEHVTVQLQTAGKVQLLFVCTHNSRRSQLAQVWAAKAAGYYNVAGINSFSGGTEVTACHPNTIATLKRAGFSISGGVEESNTAYQISIDDDYTLSCYSKLYDDTANSTSNFVALMTCSDAAENCPYIPGALARINLNYEDPKVADGTDEGAAVYEARSIQIASEMFYVMKQVKERGK